MSGEGEEFEAIDGMYEALDQGFGIVALAVDETIKVHTLRFDAKATRAATNIDPELRARFHVNLAGRLGQMGCGC